MYRHLRIQHNLDHGEAFQTCGEIDVNYHEGQDYP